MGFPWPPCASLPPGRFDARHRLKASGRPACLPGGRLPLGSPLPRPRRLPPPPEPAWGSPSLPTDQLVWVFPPLAVAAGRRCCSSDTCWGFSSSGLTCAWTRLSSASQLGTPGRQQPGSAGSPRRSPGRSRWSTENLGCGRRPPPPQA